MKYTRIVNGYATDTVSEYPAELFHPIISAEFIECPDRVENGWQYKDGEWLAPAVSAAPEKPPAEQTQFEKDQALYKKRAAVKDDLMAYMAADNMSRVRSGVWSISDLTALLEDPAVASANTLMGTLAFELAAAQISAATTPLLTPEIKADWVARLEAHYYLEQ